MNLSSNFVGNSNDETNFSIRLLVTNTQVPRLKKAFTKNLSANTKLSKTPLHKIEQSEGFLGILLGPLLKTGLCLVKNLLKTLAKNLLISSRYSYLKGNLWIR